jgi:hypothetical protein
LLLIKWLKTILKQLSVRLNRTQEYTEAFIGIFFHPKFERYLVKQMAMYRGIILRTALDLERISHHEHEQETSILSYVPFTIRSVERTDDDRRMTICFDECQDYQCQPKDLL